MPKSLAGTTVLYQDSALSQNGLIQWATITSGTIPTTASVWELGARVLDLSSGILYRNTGTTASPSFNDEDSISASEIADGAVTPVKTAQTEAVTATADGLTTGVVSITARHITVTSSVNTKIVTLPASVEGKEITGFVGSNGFRLQTTAASNITINGVDSDGTSYFDVAADTYFVARCVSATAWLVYVLNTSGGLPAGNLATDSVTTVKVAAGAITPVKSAQTEAVTATVDGLTTGTVTATARHITITSSVATKIVVLPTEVAGKEITGYVGANGFQLQTLASSNVKINNVDCDGTNSFNVPANSFFRAVCLSATDWNVITYSIAGSKTSVAALTATADGLTTGLIPAGTTFVSATSAGATNALTLPAIAAGSIGQTIDIQVATNGYELLTPASSNNTINGVDSDGTNQLDVAADTLLRCVQVSATGWIAYQVAATTITVVAPDND